MTNHELALSRSPGGTLCSKASSDKTISRRSSDASFTESELEKDFCKSDSENEHGKIAWHYLTFETELPSPSSFYSSRTDSIQSAPAPPDLSQYINPFDWSPARKAAILWVSCVATCFTTFAAAAYAPGNRKMMAYFHVDFVPVMAGVTVYTAGFAIAPMVLAPFSELNGRRPVFLASGMLFVILQVCCAVTHSFGGMLAARFVLGVGGSTFSSLVGGCVSDLYHKKDRNRPMALFSGAGLVGAGIGPLCAGLIAEWTTWRWIYWLQFFMNATLLVVMYFLFRETRGSVVLSRKAAALNAWYEKREAAGYYGFNMPSNDGLEKKTSQRVRWKVKSDEERATVAQILRVSLGRPFHLLLTEPVVFFFSLWVSFSWTVLNLFFTAISLIMSATYGFDVAENGASLTAITIGAVVATTYSLFQEDLAIRCWGESRTLFNSRLKIDFRCPEGRLYFSCFQTLLLPLGMFLFGWTVRPSVHWIVPLIGVAITTMGIFSIYLATFNYLADTYHRYASSALAAQSFCRNMMGGTSPLFTVKLYTTMGYGGASSFVAGVALLLSFVPWVLVLCGPRIRARSRFAREIMG